MSNRSQRRAGRPTGIVLWTGFCVAGAALALGLMGIAEALDFSRVNDDGESAFFLACMLSGPAVLALDSLVLWAGLVVLEWAVIWLLGYLAAGRPALRPVVGGLLLIFLVIGFHLT